MTNQNYNTNYQGNDFLANSNLVHVDAYTRDDGTPVREQRIGWIAMFCCGANNKLTTQWKKLSHTFETGTVAKDNIFRWWQGTEKACVYMYLNVPAGQSIEFRNIKLEELPDTK